MLFLAHQVGMGAGAGIVFTSLDVDGILQSIINVFNNNTATLVTNLTTATQINLIKDGDPNVAIPVTLDRYPAIIIKLAKETEKFSQLGSSTKHLYELNFEIYPMIYQGLGASESDQDIRIMTKNICKVLKDNIKLSNTAISSLPGTVDYEPDLDGVYCSVARIDFISYHLNL